MPGLTLCWEYLAGYAVATDPSSRERAEWPPHPARVFMAMAAAWFETAPPEAAADDATAADHAAEGEALRWLETLGDPELWLPPSEPGAERSVVTVYVPVNDKAGPSAATLQSVPSLNRPKQGRTFPKRHVGQTSCYLHWTGAEEVERYRDQLDRLCGKVTRIGHSSSLVRMWVADEPGTSSGTPLERWEPASAAAAVHCRRISRGTLDELPVRTGIPRIEAFAERVWAIEDAEHRVAKAKARGNADVKKAANKSLKRAKGVYEEAYGERYKKSATPPPRLRPQFGQWTGYRRADEHEALSDRPHSRFDTDLLVLTRVDGPWLPVVSAVAVAEAVRGAVMKHSGIQPVPPWVSGHQSDGSPSASDAGHLAFVPLPFVGHPHADGHLLGLGLAFPRDVPREERGKVLGPLLLQESGQPREVELRLGRLGVWVVRKRDWTETREALVPETWTAHPEGATCWASATPVVLDRFPKANHGEPKDRGVWEFEVRETVAAGCQRIGLPRPIEIDIDTTSWLSGSPRAVAKRRRLRRRAEGKHSEATATVGDGFPPYPPKGTNAPRPQVHVFLRFGEPVLGPVLVGAGRYRGYGLFKPQRAR